MDKGSINRVILVGHLGNDPESRYMPSGDAVTTFRLATNEGWRDSEGQLKDHTEWHRCVVFGKLAETASKLLKKGQLIYMEGKLRTRSWEDKDGVNRYTTEVVTNMFTMLGRKSEHAETASAEVPASSAGETPSEKSSAENDLPF